MAAQFQYRPDIDGLRAIAVVAVVLYHAGIPALGGGFVGVDVFFVISGYLITSIIKKELDKNSFSVANFYQRRIRRILPTLFVVLAFSAGIGWYLLAPEDFVNLGKSIVATVIFSSNVIFWRQAGYFDSSFAEKPLLHTWSLAVEEQFYVVFPLYLLFITRFLPRQCIRITVAIAVLSFLMNAIGVYYAPSATFYLAPTRAWELLIGAVLAMGAIPAHSNAKLRNLGSLAGLVLIILSAVGYSRDTRFPGLAALVPALGAALIIWTGADNRPPANNLLAMRPFVFVGKISYSLYMWHFPILAFATYANLVRLDATHTFMWVVVISILSVLSWRFIEQPFRGRGGILTRSQLFSAAAGLTCAFSAFGFGVYAAGGFQGIFGSEGVAIQAAMRDLNRKNNEYISCSELPRTRWTVDGLCRLGARADPAIHVIVWGNSHATALAPGIAAAAARSGKGALFAAYSACHIAIGIRIQRNSGFNPFCTEFNDTILQLVISNPAISDVVLVSRWAEGPYKNEDSSGPVPLMSDDSMQAGTQAESWAVYVRGFKRLIARLSASGKRIWIIGPVPEVGYNVPRTFYLQSLGLLNGLDIRPTQEEFFARQVPVFKMFDEVSSKYAVYVIWPHEALCEDGICDVQRDGQLLYSDDDHMSVFGAKAISTIFDTIFKKREGSGSNRS